MKQSASPIVTTVTTVTTRSACCLLFLKSLILASDHISHFVRVYPLLCTQIYMDFDHISFILCYALNYAFWSHFVCPLLCAQLCILITFRLSSAVRSTMDFDHISFVLCSALYYAFWSRQMLYLFWLFFIQLLTSRHPLWHTRLRARDSGQFKLISYFCGRWYIFMEHFILQRRHIHSRLWCCSCPTSCPFSTRLDVRTLSPPNWKSGNNQKLKGEPFIPRRPRPMKELKGGHDRFCLFGFRVGSVVHSIHWFLEIQNRYCSKT